MHVNIMDTELLIYNNGIFKCATGALVRIHKGLIKTTQRTTTILDLSLSYIFSGMIRTTFLIKFYHYTFYIYEILLYDYSQKLSIFKNSKLTIFPYKIIEYPFYISTVLFTALSGSLIILDLQINMITTIQWECFKAFSTHLKMFTTEAEFCFPGKSLLHCYNNVVGEISDKR